MTANDIYSRSTAISLFLGYHSPYRQTPVQPVRLLVEPGYEEQHNKPNASPRPSILRKRDHDNSPVKGTTVTYTHTHKHARACRVRQ